MLAKYFKLTIIMCTFKLKLICTSLDLIALWACINKLSVILLILYYAIAHNNILKLLVKNTN
jgi:hypothetical protein